MDLGMPIVWILLAIGVAVIQWWVVVFAVRRGMQDHTIWQYTQWPVMKKKIDDGQVDSKGFPVP
jgi:hypothetical protein